MTATPSRGGRFRPALLRGFPPGGAGAAGAPAPGALVRAVLAATGAVALGTGVSVAAAGSAAIPGALPGAASNESVLRFYAVWWAAQGPAAWRLARAPVLDERAVRQLCAATFVGGLARLAAVQTSGWPHPLFRALTAVELLSPPLLLALTRRAGLQDGGGPS